MNRPRLMGSGARRGGAPDRDPARFQCLTAGQLTEEHVDRAITIAGGPVKVWLVSSENSEDGRWTVLEVRAQGGGIGSRTVSSATTVLLHRHLYI